MFEGDGGIRLAAVIPLFLLSLLPAVINGYPLLYPDSVGYFHSGYSLLSHLHVLRHGPGAAFIERPASLRIEAQDGISTARSVYYGAGYATLYLLFGEWMLALLQTGITTLAIVLVTTRLCPRYWFITAILLTQLTGLSVFSVTIMPDLFTGLLLLAFAVVLTYSKVLSRSELTFWVVLALFSCLFHKSNVAILALTWATIAPFAWKTKKTELLIFSAIFAAAFLGHVAVTLVVKDVSGRWPVEPPFVLARLVGDGTAVKYLRKTCPIHHYVTCNYLREMPLTEVQFLWGHEPNKSVMGTASPQIRRQITGEAAGIAVGTITSFPFEQIKHSAGNTLRQFVTVGVTEFSIIPTDEVAPINRYRSALTNYASSAVAERRMPLEAISLMMVITYVLSLLGVLWIMATTDKREYNPPIKWFVTVLLVGLVQNAFICGAISGVFDRYQGRVAWLAPLALIALCCAYSGKSWTKR
jgi:hypothetical protein